MENKYTFGDILVPTEKAIEMNVLNKDEASIFICKTSGHPDNGLIDVLKKIER